MEADETGGRRTGRRSPHEQRSAIATLGGACAPPVPGSQI